MKKFLRILFVGIFLILAIMSLSHPIKTETNILRTVVSEKNTNLLDLSNLYSAKINILVEGEEPEEVSETADKFNESALENNLKSISVDGNKILELYKDARAGLLSANTAKLLEKNDYEKVKENTIEMIYNPLGFSLLKPEEDPFLLFTDYIANLGDNINPDGIINYEDKYYRILNYEFDKDISLSPSLLNKRVKKIIGIQKQLSVNGVNVYLTGTPVHSYYASSRSMMEINIICVLSAIFVIFLCLTYFKNISVLIPVASSLLLGGTAGFFVTSLMFPSIHVLTFVFSTTLIGISVDYSLHFFVSKTKEKTGDEVLKEIFKSLSVSLLTTISAFLVLFFSHMELLKQIAAFTVTGLITVYLFVVLFYPVICKKIDVNNSSENPRWNFIFSPATRKIIMIILGIITISGLFFTTTNDDIRSMYKPSKKLMQAETLFANVVGINPKTSFVVVEGKNLQDVLEKEEHITEIIGATKYQAISKFIPSKSKQAKNRALMQKLYDTEISPYTSALKASSKVPAGDYLVYDKESFPFLEGFFLDENKTLMILYDFDKPELLSEIDGVEYYNIQQDISNLVKECRVNCAKLLIPVFILLFGLLAVIYKPKNALKIILPPLCACIFTIGLLGLLHISLNLFHIIAMFLIIGFSLDYSVFRFNGKKLVSDAVFMSCMTSVFSFMLLAFTGFKLISSLGFVLSVGLLSSYILSLLLISKEE